MKVKVTQLGPTLCDLTDYTVHGILQAPSLQVDSLPAEPQGKPKNSRVGGLSLLQWIFLAQELNWDLLHCRQIPGFPGIIFVVYATDTLIYIDIADVGLENQTHLFSRFCSDYSYH